MKVVRQSKYRHLFGTVGQSDEQYRGIRLGTGISPESNVLKANPTYFACPWFINGAVLVVPLTQKNAIAEEPPLVMHEGPISEFNFSPFNDSHLLTAAQDGAARLFQIPEGASRSIQPNEAVVTIQATSKRLLNAEFHPTVENVVVTVTADNELKLFDVNAPESARATLAGQHKGVITSLAWNLDGTLVATSCKDKILRVSDPRAGKVVAEAKDHEGAKSGRVAWYRPKDRIVTVGFSKNTERHIRVWDPRSMAAPVSSTVVDASSASLMPFIDEDLGLLYLAGKGEVIKMYEGMDESQLHFLSEFKSNVPTSGLALLPKSVCNRNKCEVFRFLKLTTGYVVPLRFEVPRQSFTYQEDLYPPTWDQKPVANASAWFGGAAGKNPNLVQLPAPPQ